MINKTINKLQGSLVEVTVTIPWVDLEPRWNFTLQRLAAEVEIPGFRKGQAPLPMVETQLGTKLQEDIFKTIFPQLLVEALQGTEIVPIDYPRYQLLSFAKGGQLQFKATITERPQVTVGDYKNIRVSRPQLKTVTDEDVNKIVGDIYKRWKARQPLPQGVTPQANQPSGAGLMSFNQGNTTGDVSNQPDDNFAKTVGAASLADLKIKIKADLESEAKYNNELDLEEAILQEVEKLTTVGIPLILIEDELARMLVSLQRRVSDMGLLMEEYLKSQKDEKHPNGRTVEDLKVEWRVQAEKNVRMELGLAEIARREGVQVADEEVQAEVDRIPDAKLKAQFEAQEPRLHLKHSLRQMKTLTTLKGLVKAI